MSVSNWEPDPTGRHQYRWYDGTRWTDQVADNGVQGVDPISSAEAGLPRQATTLVATPPSSYSDGSELPDPISMIASRKRRFGAFLLEIPLAIVTLCIGYLIWTLIVWGRGQTPGKQVLNVRVVRLKDRRTANWGWMALRNGVLGGAVGYLLDLIFWPLAAIWLLANGIALLATPKRQALWDMIAGTVVIYDPGDLYAHRRAKSSKQTDP